MEAKKLYKFDPDYAVPPGETLLEVMESLGMTQKELALRTGLTVQTLNRIIKGQQPITYETANRLELVTGTPAHFWNNLEAQYQEQLAKLEERKKMEADVIWLKTIPTKELIERKIIQPNSTDVLLLREVFKFYKVSSLEAWNDFWLNPKVAARRSKCFETQIGPASAWIRLGELQAHTIVCKPYDREKFMAALKKIRGLTLNKPEVFVPEMKRLCAEAGVAVALVPEMKKVPWNGATKWLSHHKVMILLSLRGKGEDRFWFSFFHEAGHVLHDNKKDLLINDETKNDPREIKADAFAADILIPEKFNAAIRACRSRDAITALARQLGISPGIVAGRYQYLTNKWHYYRDLITPLNWAG